MRPILRIIGHLGVLVGSFTVVVGGGFALGQDRPEVADAVPTKPCQSIWPRPSPLGFWLPKKKVDPEVRLTQVSSGSGSPTQPRAAESSPTEIQRAAPGESSSNASSSPGSGSPTEPRAAESSPTESEKAPAPDTKFLSKLLGLQDSPVQIYGWVQNSYTGNADGTPRNGSNFSVFPNRLANAWQGNQVPYLVVENALETEDRLNLGFRVDTIFGNDWQFTKSYGLFDRAFPNNHFPGIDIPQMYAEVHLPILTKGGLDIRGGRFYSPAGFESVQAVKRPLLSVPYLFNYTPFTLFGMMATLHVNERVNLYAGAVNGWDRWIDSNYRYSFVGGINASTKDGKTTLTTVVIAGPDQLPRFAPVNSPIIPTGVITNSKLQGLVNPEYATSNRTYMSTVLTRTWSDKFNEAYEVFFVHEPDVPGLGPGGSVSRESAWYGFAHWYLYQFTPKVQGVWRAEVFHDQNGAATGVADTYYEQTIGLVVKPHPWLWFRPEARYDWAQFQHPFDDGTRKSQLTLACDVIIQF